MSIQKSVDRIRQTCRIKISVSTSLMMYILCSMIHGIWHEMICMTFIKGLVLCFIMVCIAIGIFIFVLDKLSQPKDSNAYLTTYYTIFFNESYVEETRIKRSSKSQVTSSFYVSIDDCITSFKYSHTRYVWSVENCRWIGTDWNKNS